MRRFFSILIVVLFAFGITINDASAKRFGSGRNFGISRASSSYSRIQPIQTPHQTFLANKNRWLGPLAGLMAGGLLASLFMGHGFGSGILSWLLIAGVCLFLFNLVRNLQRNKLQTAAQPMQFQGFKENLAYNIASETNNTTNYPAGFDESTFLRDARAQFFRLQTAYDQKNLSDLREFTTPEVFAEIQVQLHERGNEENITEVVTLASELLDAKTELQTIISSVRFSGSIREDQNKAAEPFEETWHFKKDSTHQRWLVAGIQQKQ